MERSVCSPPPSTMTVAGGETTGIITVHRTLTSFKPCAETPNQYHRRYPCDQQEGRKVFESAIRAASAKLMR